jgi:hypothetical protein
MPVTQYFGSVPYVFLPSFICSCMVLGIYLASYFPDRIYLPHFRIRYLVFPRLLQPHRHPITFSDPDIVPDPRSIFVLTVEYLLSRLISDSRISQISSLPYRFSYTNLNAYNFIKNKFFESSPTQESFVPKKKKKKKKISGFEYPTFTRMCLCMCINMVYFRSRAGQIGHAFRLDNH